MTSLPYVNTPALAVLFRPQPITLLLSPIGALFLRDSQWKLMGWTIKPLILQVYNSVFFYMWFALFAACFMLVYSLA
jgi:hypothetical protein